MPRTSDTSSVESKLFPSATHYLLSRLIQAKNQCSFDIYISDTQDQQIYLFIIISVYVVLLKPLKFLCVPQPELCSNTRRLSHQRFPEEEHERDSLAPDPIPTHTSVGSTDLNYYTTPHQMVRW